MNKLIFITYFLISFSKLGAQSVLEAEGKWKSNSDSNYSSYKQIFQFDHKFIPDDSLSTTSKKLKLNFAPEILGAYQREKIEYIAGLKILGEAKINSKIEANFLYSATYSNTQNTPYIGDLQTKAYFKNSFNNSSGIYHDLRGRIRYKANDYIQFQTGIDKQFIGEGDRSLLSGNQGFASPFLLMKANFWKFEYYTIHQIWREGKPNHYLPKANATHYLNFNLGPKFSLGIFETVVHVIKDTLYNRGFEVEYLNPLIFYRPQEYSNGSTDNVILGLNGFLTWGQKIKNLIYGQFVLDDINIQEIKNKSKWWANKYGIQLGYKVWFKVKNTDMFARTEINVITPFTFSATDLSTNYSNQGLPNAHPLGSNFLESYSEFAFKIKKYEINSWVQFYKKGNDYLNNPSSYGGDIFKSYNNRISDYGIALGIGETTYSFQFGTKISREIIFIKRQKNIKAFIEPRLFLKKRTPKIENDLFFTIGIHSDFGDNKRNY